VPISINRSGRFVTGAVPPPAGAFAFGNSAGGGVPGAGGGVGWVVVGAGAGGGADFCGGNSVVHSRMTPTHRPIAMTRRFSILGGPLEMPFGHRIEAGPAEWMAAQQTARRQPDAAPRAVRPDRLLGVGGA